MQSIWYFSIIVISISCLISNLNCQVKIAIIGSGVSGLSAARFLLNASSHDIIVYEAHPNRTGGRTWSFPIPGTGATVDLGAFWMHAADDPKQPVKRYCDEHGIPVRLHPYDINNTQILMGNISEELIQQALQIVEVMRKNSLLYHNRSDLQDMPVFEALRTFEPQVYTELQQNPLLNYFVTEWIEGSEGNQAALIGTRMVSVMLNATPMLDLDEETGADMVITDPRSYSAFLDSLVTAGARKIQTRTNYKLIGVNYTANDSVRLQFENRPEVIVDYVIITVPLGVLKSKAVNFDPPLPRAKLDAWNRTGVGNFAKALLVFNEVFWDPAMDFIIPLPDNKTESKDPNYIRIVYANVYPLHQVPALLGAITGDYANKAENLTEMQLQAQLLKQIAAAFPNYDPQKHLLTYFMRTKWLSDPLFRGCYSHGKVGMQYEDAIELKRPLSNRVFFAGEHTMYQERAQATVHGAFRSGERAADWVLDEIARDSKGSPADWLQANWQLFLLTSVIQISHGLFAS